MGICVTKPNTKQPKTLIRLIKIENENTIPKPINLVEIQVKLLQIWLRVEKSLNKLVPCERTQKILEQKKLVSTLLGQENSRLPMQETTTGKIIEHMEKIAFEIEEIVREELLIEEVSKKFSIFHTQIIELSVEYFNWKNNSQADGTQVSSFI